LLYLVSLGLWSLGLQIQDLWYVLTRKNVMTSPGALFKTQLFQQRAQTREFNVAVAGARRRSAILTTGCRGLLRRSLPEPAVKIEIFAAISKIFRSNYSEPFWMYQRSCRMRGAIFSGERERYNARGGCFTETGIELPRKLLLPCGFVTLRGQF
jgi:hypothetical protein